MNNDQRYRLFSTEAWPGDVFQGIKAHPCASRLMSDPHITSVVVDERELRYPDRKMPLNTKENSLDAQAQLVLCLAPQRGIEQMVRSLRSLRPILPLPFAGLEIA